MAGRCALSDVAADRSAEQLRQLSDEVSRIAAMLARLSTGPEPAPRAIQPAETGEVPPVSPDTVRKVIRARRLRARFFPEELFADPAWDMLLDLLQAELSHLRVPVSSLCIAAAVPATTALRWLKTMVGEGLFVRRADPHDGRRVFVELAPRRARRAAPLFRGGRRGGGGVSRLRGGRLSWHERQRGRLAQLVEHLVYTERVGGSSPSAPTIIAVRGRVGTANSKPLEFRLSRRHL